MTLGGGADSEGGTLAGKHLGDGRLTDSRRTGNFSHGNGYAHAKHT